MIILILLQQINLLKMNVMKKKQTAIREYAQKIVSTEKVFQILCSL